MITITFKITEIDKRIKIESGGGSRAGTSRLERDFTKKLLTHINKFNTSYKRLGRKHIKMRQIDGNKDRS
jgi:hypothetical protein